LGHALSLFDALQELTRQTGKHTRDKECARAPFGWQGGKSKSLDQILPHLPYRASYIEVFGGSGAVLLQRHASPLEVYNDKYGGIVGFYRCVRDVKKLDALISRLQLIVHSREEFVWCRETWESCSDDVERAARWYYMIQSSFANKGKAWARASYVKGQIGDKLRNNIRLFGVVHARLKGVQVENQDWRRIIEDYDMPDAVFYMDPPYLDTSSTSYDFEMPLKDHKELLDSVFKMKGFVAISGYGHPEYIDRGWDHIVKWTVAVTTVGQACREENSRLESHGMRQATEYLFIKEAE